MLQQSPFSVRHFHVISIDEIVVKASNQLEQKINLKNIFSVISSQHMDVIAMNKLLEFVLFTTTASEKGIVAGGLYFPTVRSQKRMKLYFIISRISLHTIYT